MKNSLQGKIIKNMYQTSKDSENDAKKIDDEKRVDRRQKINNSLFADNLLKSTDDSGYAASNLNTDRDYL